MSRSSVRWLKSANNTLGVLTRANTTEAQRAEWKINRLKGSEEPQGTLCYPTEKEENAPFWALPGYKTDTGWPIDTREPVIIQQGTRYRFVFITARNYALDVVSRLVMNEGFINPTVWEGTYFQKPSDWDDKRAGIDTDQIQNSLTNVDRGYPLSAYYVDALYTSKVPKISYGAYVNGCISDAWVLDSATGLCVPKGAKPPPPKPPSPDAARASATDESSGILLIGAVAVAAALYFATRKSEK